MRNWCLIRQQRRRFIWLEPGCGPGFGNQFWRRHKQKFPCYSKQKRLIERVIRTCLVILGFMYFRRIFSVHIFIQKLKSKSISVSLSFLSLTLCLSIYLSINPSPFFSVLFFSIPLSKYLKPSLTYPFANIYIIQYWRGNNIVNEEVYYIDLIISL